MPLNISVDLDASDSELETLDCKPPNGGSTITPQKKRRLSNFLDAEVENKCEIEHDTGAAFLTGPTTFKPPHLLSE